MHFPRMELFSLLAQKCLNFRQNPVLALADGIHFLANKGWGMARSLIRANGGQNIVASAAFEREEVVNLPNGYRSFRIGQMPSPSHW